VLMAEEMEETPDILKMTVAGIQPAQEVIVTITVLQVLEVECGAYLLRIPHCFFVKYDNSESVKQTLYSYEIAICCQQKLDFLSIPKGSV
jgi:hypothetical protein